MADLIPRKETRELLVTLLPAWNALKTSRVLHAYRLWGPRATFPTEIFPNFFDHRIFTGPELASYLLDHRFYSQLLPGERPLLIRSPYGVTVRTSPSGRLNHFVETLAHSDDLLAGCAEVGLPSDSEIFAADAMSRPAKATVADMILDSLARFTIRQELPWTAEALARYLAPYQSWMNRFGERFSFDQIVTQLLQEEPGTTACYGVHTVYALACLFRISETFPILSGTSRDRIADRLRNVSANLNRKAIREGAWSSSWAASESRASSPQTVSESILSATGHHLEWIALAPADLRPRKSAIEIAISSVFRYVNSGWLNNPEARSVSYADLSHLGRAISLLASNDPNSIVRNWN